MKTKQFSTYGPLCSRFYELEFESREQKITTATEQIQFFLEEAQQTKGPILEPMCGTGRFLIPLLAAGFDAEGFDASLPMLTELKKRYTQISHAKPPIHHALIQEFSPARKYGLIFIPFGSLGLIPIEHLPACLTNIFQWLLPNGTFICEIDTVASLPRTLGTQHRGSHTDTNGSIISLKTIESYDEITQIFSAECLYERTHLDVILETEQESFKQYLYQLSELDFLLKMAGFTTLEKYQSYALTPATTSKTPMLLYRCKK